MSKSTSDLKEIVRVGGGINIDGNSYAPMDLKEMARQANASGATIIIRNAINKSTADLKEIARAAPGKVVFEL